MSRQLIKAFPDFSKPVYKSVPNLAIPFLNISEFFYDTIQGEGVTTGCPAAILRLKDCTLNCSYCDTKSTYRFGNPYTFNELFNLISSPKLGLIEKFRNGQHLILTGGSPLLQQDALVLFLKKFRKRYDFLSYLEVENECTIMPDWDLIAMVNCWNNSPKLCNSGNPWSARYYPEIIRYMSELNNSWFKFVVYEKCDWDEIEEDFLSPDLLKRDQIILMPKGATREELERNQEFVVNLAIRENVRYSSREQIVLWGQKQGV